MAAILLCLAVLVGVAGAGEANRAGGITISVLILYLIVAVLLSSSFITNAIDMVRRRATAEHKELTAALKSLGEHRATEARLRELGPGLRQD